MYNFIVDLFTEGEYSELLGGNEGGFKNEKTKILVVPPNTDNSPFIIKNIGIEDEIDETPLLDEYNRGKLLEYFNFNKFVNPTHNNANNIVQIRPWRD